MPLISHPPLKPFVNGNVLDVGVTPQAIVIGTGVVIVGNAAGLTVIV